MITQIESKAPRVTDKKNDPLFFAYVKLMRAIVERAEMDATGSVTGVRDDGSRHAVTAEAVEWLNWLRS